jgi:hypothetical protein
MATFLWILVTILLKWLPHTANYSAEIAMTVYLARQYSWRRASLLMVMTVTLSDLGLAAFYGYPAWGNWAIINDLTLMAIIALCAKPRIKLKYIDWPGQAWLAAFFYWFITNLGVWLVGTGYAMTWQGLTYCYYMALPFLPAQMLSALTFSYVWLGLVWLSRHKQTILKMGRYIPFAFRNAKLG